jgi:hypothetical protein
MSPKQSKQKDSRNRTRNKLPYNIKNTSNENPNMSEPSVDSSVLSVYIQYALGHGVRLDVTLSEIYDPKGGNVASNVFEMLKAKLLRHNESIAKGCKTSM